MVQMYRHFSTKHRIVLVELQAIELDVKIIFSSSKNPNIEYEFDAIVFGGAFKIISLPDK